MIALLIIIGAIVVIGGWFVTTYNSLVKANIRVDEAWSDITIQLKRRYDLIPTIVNTVKGYASHEKDVFESVTKARTAAMNATAGGSVSEVAQADNAFTSTLKTLFAVAEAYPELKSGENFLHLQEELVDTEDKIQAARRFYNGAVSNLNIKIKQIPTSLIAGMLGYKVREMFKVDNQDEVEQPVDVQF